MSRRAALLAVEILVPAAIVAGAIGWAHSAHSYYFPPATRIWSQFSSTFLHSDKGFSTVLWPTLARTLEGYGVAIGAGLLLGLLLTASQRLMRMSSPTVEFMRATPSPTMIPFIVLVFGIGETSKVALIALGSVWPILLNTIDGLRGVDPMFEEMGRSYGVGPFGRLWRVRLPAASPQIFAGLRTSLAIALILAVVSEMLSGIDGFGFYINEGQSLFNIPQMWVGIIVIGILGYVLNALFVLVEHRVLGWHRGARAGAN
jgi:ABC-type nitrate/sulfonate/bicarbonate transport system permease component